MIRMTLHERDCAATDGRSATPKEWGRVRPRMSAMRVRCRIDLQCRRTSDGTCDLSDVCIYHENQNTNTKERTRNGANETSASSAGKKTKTTNTHTQVYANIDLNL